MKDLKLCAEQMLVMRAALDGAASVVRLAYLKLCATEGKGGANAALEATLHEWQKGLTVRLAQLELELEPTKHPYFCDCDRGLNPGLRLVSQAAQSGRVVKRKKAL